MREKVQERVLCPERKDSGLAARWELLRGEKEHAWREMEGSQPEPPVGEIRSRATNLVSLERAGCRGAIPTLELGGRAPTLLISLGLALRQ